MIVNLLPAIANIYNLHLICPNYILPVFVHTTCLCIIISRYLVPIICSSVLASPFCFDPHNRSTLSCEYRVVLTWRNRSARLASHLPKLHAPRTGTLKQVQGQGLPAYPYMPTLSVFHLRAVKGKCGSLPPNVLLLLGTYVFIS